MAQKLLVVDDEEDYRIIIRDVLSHAGYDVLTCSNGGEALKTLETFLADAVLVDWMMPKMDGETFCRCVRSQPRLRTLPLLMLTVKRTADEELEALHFGVDDFLIKPFTSEELLARVRAALRRRAEPAR